MARQEADASSHAFDVWSGRMVTARTTVVTGRTNRCRTCSRNGGHGTATREDEPGGHDARGVPDVAAGYSSTCSIPCLETFPRVTTDTSLSSIQSGLVSGALSRHAHAW